MKTKDILLLGGAGLVAYYFLSRKAPSPPSPEPSGFPSYDLEKLLWQLSGGLLGNAQGGQTQTYTPPAFNFENPLLSMNSIRLGGQGLLAASPITGAYGGFSSGQANIAANADWINAFSGTRAIQGTASTTSGGFPLLTFAGTNAGSQMLLNRAISAVPQNVGVYGYTPRAGGAVVYGFGAPSATTGASGGSGSSGGGSGSGGGMPTGAQMAAMQQAINAQNIVLRSLGFRR